MSKQTTPAITEAEGVLLSLCLYIMFQLILAFLGVRSVLPESKLFPAQMVTCVLSVIIGSLFAIRRTRLGTLCAAMIVAGCFALVLLLGGLLIYDDVTWAGKGGALLLAILCGGVLSGLFGSRQKKKRKNKALSRKVS